MCTSGNRDSQLTSRSVLKDFTADALTTSAGPLFPKWGSMSAESVLAMLVELICVAV